MEKRRRRPYWRLTKWHALMGLAVPLMLVLSLPMFAVGISDGRIWGFPVGYAMIAHGAVLIGIVAVLRFIGRQDSVDRWHGAHEDL